jgi:hypothetical protein
MAVNMPERNGNHLERAAEQWRGGQPLEAGRIIFDNLQPAMRPTWASRILRSVVEKSRVRFSPIEEILRIADNPTEWGKAHGAFSLLRKSTLNLERLQSKSREETLLLSHLYLAENVAKVIYNATHPSDAFDEESGWWIARCLKDVLDLLDDEDFSEEAWLELCSHDP